jgi:hypothetical protein
MKMDLLNLSIAVLSLLAVAWGVYLHRREVSMQAHEAERRDQELRQNLEELRCQNRLLTRLVSLLAVSTYAQSHQAARASFPKVKLSRRASERVRIANVASSRFLDEILAETGLLAPGGGEVAGRGRGAAPASC